MIKINKSKIVSALTIAAISATAVLGSFAASQVFVKDTTPSIAYADGIVNKTSEAEATIYYIGTTEDGGKGGDGTSADTFMSFAIFFNRYLENLKPGDIVRVMPGEHYLDSTVTINASGTYDDYIIFEPADSTQATTLNFKKQVFASTNRGVQINGSYIYWKNIDVCGAGDNGMYIGGSYNVVENCQFYNNRDTGLQLGRSYSEYSSISQWPSYNLIKNCSSFNNYDNETYGENADGFAAKLTVGYGNIFDGCIAYRNSDDGWDLYGKSDTGNIGCVIIYNCVAFENGYLQKTQKECNDWFTYTVDGEEVSSYNKKYDEANTNSYMTRDGDGNGFKLGGSTMEGDVIMYNCLSFNNRMHGVTDNSNPGVLSVNNVTSYNNGIQLSNVSHTSIVDTFGNTNTNYYTVDQDGYIVNSSNKKIVLNESGVNKSTYASLDSEGYILNSLETRVTEGDPAAEVKGTYAKVDTTASVVNTSFGYVANATIASDDRCNNIDIERTDSSYNNFSGLVSVVDSANNSYTGSDRYRGAGEYSVLVERGSTDTYKKITESMDADYLNSKKGTSTTALTTSLFTALPAANMGLSDSVHATYRNADGSLNMGDILKIADYSSLFGDTHKIGSQLSASSWADYEHYTYTYLTDSSVTSSEDALLTAVSNMLYVPVGNACYQDFSVITEMNGCTISWASSDASILSVGTQVSTTASNGKSVNVAVYRGSEDTQVTLTATITTPSKSTKQKTFTITVKQIELSIGDIQVEGVDQNNTIIIDQFANYDQPEVTVTNASDYNGKLLPSSAYTLSYVYKYSTGKGGVQNAVYKFTPSNAGVYEITATAKLGSVSKSITYTIYVASSSATVDFVTAEGAEDVSVSVNKDGYNITGNVNNVTGTLYTMVASAQPTGDELKASGVAYSFKGDSISADFAADNTKAYTVYYALYNVDGNLTSQIYKTDIAIEEISTKEAFQELAKNGGVSNKIYQLTADLDYTGTTWTVGSNGFVGYLDGQGHKISGISVLDATSNGKASVFYQLNGGTIVNIQFANITLKNTGNQVGIIGQAYSGTLENIKMTNIACQGAQRVGGLIGQVFEQVNGPLTISKVSLVNDEEHIITGTSQRQGGIIGFIQTNSTASLKSFVVNVVISDCFVDATIGTSTAGQSGGIVGTYDTSSQASYVSYSLTIDTCYFVGTVIANSRCGGILGYQQGLDKLRITSCVSAGNIFHAGSVAPITTAEKNASCIMGGYSSSADARIRNCFSTFDEYNTSYEVEVLESDSLSNKSFWIYRAKFDLDTVWSFTETSPYLVLNVL